MRPPLPEPPFGMCRTFSNLPLCADVVFIVHHILSSTYLVGCLLNGHGAIGCIMMFFLGEVTSPVFNAFTISK